MRPVTVALVVLLVSGQLPPVARANEKAKLEGVVNINTATDEELRLIPGVGPARVRNILAYRRAHPFRSVDELARIKGIGRKTVRRWRLHLAVGGPSTAQKVVRPEQPFVGPPPLPAPSGKSPIIQTRPSAIRPVLNPRSLPRRGDPAHGIRAPAPGNHCLPPR